MGVAVTGVDRYVKNNETRMAFHFGNVVATDGAHHFLDLTLEIDGEQAGGLSMVGIAPAWFLKDSSLTADATERLLAVFDAACEHALAMDPVPTVFELWHTLYERQREWAADTDHPPLLWSYGVSMVEQAVIDAYCRHEGVSFGRAVRDGTLGVAPGSIYPELEGVDPADYLPDEPAREAAVRHTVGLSDPIEDDDLDGEGLDDGLPQTLAEYVAVDGVDHFKIKLSADEERDAERLGRIGGVLGSELDEFVCTLDANEQYDDIAAFKTQWERHADDSELAVVVDRVAYVEQPLPRDRALTEETGEVLQAWTERPPIIIDESDDRLDSAGRALDRGYAGTSHKNCKGVFKGLVNACLIEKRRREDDREYLMSGEDLTTIGPIELLHDLAVMGTLGMDHIERNGHHYYRGLGFLPADLQQTVRDAHDDLYRCHRDGFVTLDVRDGRMEYGSVIDAPFGRDVDLDPARFTPLGEWDVASRYG